MAEKNNDYIQMYSDLIEDSNRGVLLASIKEKARLVAKDSDRLNELFFKVYTIGFKDGFEEGLDSDYRNEK